MLHNVDIISIFDKNDYILFVKNVEGGYIETNCAFQKFLNKDRKDIIGKTDRVLFRPDTCELFAERELQVTRKKTSSSHEDIIEYGGKTFYLAIARFPITDDNGNLIGICGIGHDVTSIRSTEEEINAKERARLIENEQLALQSSKMKSEFLANMSHEIRTPINGIIGLTNLLRDTTLSEEQQEYVDGIHRSCGVLMSIINDILDLSKIEAGRIELEVLDIDISSLINDLYSFFHPAAKNKNLFFVVERDFPTDALVVKADYARLRQILTNLLGNAIKFTFEGGITFRYALIQDAENGKKNMRFEVIDTGIGIDAEKVETLFRSFTQADASTTRRFGGTGLGLSISKNFVTLMKGDIGVISEPNRGSTFWVEIPYVAGDADIIEKRLRKIENDMVSSKNDAKSSLNILCVEDNPMNQKVIIRTLTKLGHKPTAADNGLEAVQLLQMNPQRFDLVLMDCAMPVMDGYEATKEIRRMPAPLRNIPIVAMTANALTDERQHVLSIGMNDYMSKPFQKDELVTILSKWTST